MLTEKKSCWLYKMFIANLLTTVVVKKFKFQKGSMCNISIQFSIISVQYYLPLCFQ